MLLSLPSKCCCGQRRIPGGCDFPHQLWEAASKVAQALGYFNTGLVLLLFKLVRISDVCLNGIGTCEVLGQSWVNKVKWCPFFNGRCNSSALKVKHLESEMPELRLHAQLQFFSFTCVRCNTAYIMMSCLLLETLVLSEWTENMAGTCLGWVGFCRMLLTSHMTVGWQRMSHEIWGGVCLQVLAMILIVAFPDIWCLIIYVK